MINNLRPRATVIITIGLLLVIAGGYSLYRYTSLFHIYNKKTPKPQPAAVANNTDKTVVMLYESPPIVDTEKISSTTVAQNSAAKGVSSPNRTVTLQGTTGQMLDPGAQAQSLTINPQNTLSATTNTVAKITQDILGARLKPLRLH